MFKFLLYLFLFYFLFRFLFGSLFKSKASYFDTNNHQNDQKPEGSISVDSDTIPKGKGSDKNPGEYVDYEEVK